MVSPSLTLLRTQSDERLVLLARAGHERAFEAIVERYRHPLLRHGRRLVGETRAEEAVQQAFLAAWTALQRGDDVRHLRGWLHRIVHNAALNALRGERDDHAELREWLECAGAPEDELERREMLRSTLANLAALPTRQREALLRIAVDGQSAEEVGSSLGLTEGAARQLLYRARSALRAAATAVTPMPVAGWFARAESLGERLVEAAAGAGSAGLGSILAKASVAVVVAGVAASPAVIDGESPRGSHPPAEASRAADLAARPAALVDARGSNGFAGALLSDRSGPSSSYDRRPRSGGSGSGGPDHGGSVTSGSGTSGPGSEGSGTSGPGSSGSGSNGSGTSGSGTSGSGTSGSGTSGSGTSGSGTSGSGTTGSSTSGSGTSGSGTSGSGTTGSTSIDLSTSGSSSSGSGSSGSLSSGSGSGSAGLD